MSQAELLQGWVTLHCGSGSTPVLGSYLRWKFIGAAPPRPKFRIRLSVKR